MKTLPLLLLSCLLLCLAGIEPLYAQTPEIAWAKQATGRTTGTYKSSQSVAHDASGNTYITGAFENMLVFGSTSVYSSGSSDIFIAKYDAAGNLLWAKTAGGTRNDTGYGIAADGSGNVFVTGLFNGTVSFDTTTLTSTSTSSDIFIAKFDTDGTLLWARQAGGAGQDAGMGIAVDNTGHAYLTGYITGTASFGTTTLTGTGTDMATFVTKYDTSGNVLWAQQFQAAREYGPYNSYGIAADSDGNSLITGCFSGTAVFGNNTLTSEGATDIYIAKLDASGTVQWARKAGGGSYDYAHSIATDNSGNAYITGSFSGTATFGTTSLNCNDLSDIFLVKYDAAGNVLWAQRSGGTGPDRGTAVATDNAGNAYVTGSFFINADFGDFSLTGSNIDIDIPTNDIYIAKYNALGLVQWAKHVSGAFFANAISADSAGHVYTTGHMGQAKNLYVARLDGSGLVEWQNYPVGYTSFDKVRSIAADAWGNTYVTGLFQGTITFGNFSLNGQYDESDIFIAKYDPSGKVLWAQKAGGYFYDSGNSITVDGSGNVYITGYYYATASFGAITLPGNGGSNTFIAKYDAAGQVLWTQRGSGAGSSSGACITTDQQGSLYLAGNFTGNLPFGSTTLSASGISNTFLVKFDASGTVQWAQKAGVNTFVNSISVDDTGHVYATGRNDGTATIGTHTLSNAGDTDMFIARYDATGQVQWAKSAGGTTKDTAFGIVADASGNAYVTGSFGGTAAFDNHSVTGEGGSDMFLAKYDASGNVLWVQKAGGTSSESGYGITADDYGNTYLTGTYSGTASFGATTLKSKGGYDVFVARYDASGNPQWAMSGGSTGNDTGVSIALDGKGNAFITGTFEAALTLGSNTLTSYGTETFIVKLANAAEPTGIAPGKAVASLLLYPNPIRDKLHLHLPLSSRSNPELRVLDSSGKLLLQHQYTTLAGEFNQVLDLSSLAQGVYMLQLIMDQEVITKRILKE